ncbi:HNH endonuclease [Candidatus Woesearchaeota archaeon]|nr:HNH endonuclease [Candidatus Woesearchaeota archaeon]
MEVGDIIDYWQMCAEEGASLQRGMNYRLKGKNTVILMSLRPNAPYADRVEENGKVLIYEGHDVARSLSKNPKMENQPREVNGKLTQNGLFQAAVARYKDGAQPELVRVYEKVRDGIWTYNGIFKLVECWNEESEKRDVFKFRLEVTDEQISWQAQDLEHNRIIPASVKITVWRRDKAACVICQSKDNLHFDHIIPFSKGGSSLIAENIQVLCARHNLSKRDKIE